MICVPSTQMVMMLLTVTIFTWFVALRSGGARLNAPSQRSRLGVVELVGPSLTPRKLLDGLTEFLYVSSATARPVIPEKPRPPPLAPSDVGTLPRVASPITSASPAAPVPP